MSLYRKAIAALVLTLTGAIAGGLIVGAPAAWIGVIVSALTTAGVFYAPNELEGGRR